MTELNNIAVGKSVDAAQSLPGGTVSEVYQKKRKEERREEEENQEKGRKRGKREGRSIERKRYARAMLSKESPVLTVYVPQDDPPLALNKRYEKRRRVEKGGGREGEEKAYTVQGAFEMI